MTMLESSGAKDGSVARRARGWYRSAMYVHRIFRIITKYMIIANVSCGLSVVLLAYRRYAAPQYIRG